MAERRRNHLDIVPDIYAMRNIFQSLLFGARVVHKE